MVTVEMYLTTLLSNTTDALQSMYWNIRRNLNVNFTEESTWRSKEEDGDNDIEREKWS